MTAYRGHRETKRSGQHYGKEQQIDFV